MCYKQNTKYLRDLLLITCNLTVSLVADLENIFRTGFKNAIGNP